MPGPIFWWALGSTGVVLAVFNVLQIVMYLQVGYPAMRDGEIEHGIQMPNRNWAFVVLFLLPILLLPILSIVAGIEALVASIAMLTLK